uniref:Speckle-type POZ protein (inferred by orthology to a human protein) n=1 Tax=Strongyloides venezuelensis TaxID=75913 RepID=A0A0K0G2Y1_STRVS
MAESSRVCIDDSTVCPKSDNSTGSIVTNDFNISYQWTIGNFFEILHTRKSKLEIESPSFSVLGYPNVLFKMYFLLRVESSEDTSYWGLILKAFSPSSNDELNIDISHKFSLTSQKRDKIFWNSRVLENVFYFEKLTRNQCGVESCIALETIKESLFSSGALNVTCDIMYKENVEDLICRNNNNEELESDILNYKRYFRQLFEMFISVNTSDCTIEFGGRIYRVHKFILMAHSLVFKELFMDPNSDESKGNCICIRDKVGFESFDLMISYFYGATIPSDIRGKDFEELLHLADTYKINNLKILCQGMLNI